MISRLWFLSVRELVEWYIGGKCVPFRKNDCSIHYINTILMDININLRYINTLLADIDTNVEYINTNFNDINKFHIKGLCWNNQQSPFDLGSFIHHFIKHK